MALFHDATITPTKAELIAAWAPSQPWCPDPEATIEVIGAYRFDDPEGRVGMEAHLVTCGDTLVHVPLTYREAPVGGAENSLVGEMQHSALGTRCVYDGLQDERFILMLAAVAMTGQGEALGMVTYDGKWFIAPTNVRLRGGGWTGARVSVDDLVPMSGDPSTPRYRNERFELTVYRRPVVGPQPALGLTATWEGAPGSVVLAEVRQRS